MMSSTRNLSGSSLAIVRPKRKGEHLPQGLASCVGVATVGHKPILNWLEQLSARQHQQHSSYNIGCLEVLTHYVSLWEYF